MATFSAEADVRPVQDDADEHLATVIDGVLGEMSEFHQLHGSYAQGVGPRTAVLPHGWLDRLVPISSEATSYCIGWCLDVHDLCASKLLANRTKDHTFVRGLIEGNLVDVTTLRDRLASTTADERVAVAAQTFLATFPDNSARYVAAALPVVDLSDPSHPRNLISEDGLEVNVAEEL
ncbi:DUF6036 family nucleotidyltransferase [Microbacterium sp. SLBN-111]|uniref:DUF6036 family nucleotidyltransferase n=1 Tax=Microbacterium sp. SLBN-111 TaxID=3377733 RepID=UPI003C76DBC3